MSRLMLCAAAAFALSAYAEGSSANQGGVDATKVGEKIDHGAAALKKESEKVSKEMKANAEEWERQAGIANEAQGTFRADRAYSLEGTARKLSFGKLTIERPGLPAATLSVRSRTEVTLDGQKVDARAIPQGAEVRARFQLEGGSPVAVSIEAHAAAESRPPVNAAPADSR